LGQPAKKEGYEQIAGFFEEETADMKKNMPKTVVHKLAIGGAIKSTSGKPGRKAQGENEEYTSMYPEMERIAPGKKALMKLQMFSGKSVEVEEAHEKLYLKCWKTLKTILFSKGFHLRSNGNAATADTSTKALSPGTLPGLRTTPVLTTKRLAENLLNPLL
jgi:hypothetical protein